jgi:hypothetical protein
VLLFYIIPTLQTDNKFWSDHVGLTAHVTAASAEGSPANPPPPAKQRAQSATAAALAPPQPAGNSLSPTPLTSSAKQRAPSATAAASAPPSTAGNSLPLPPSHSATFVSLAHERPVLWPFSILSSLVTVCNNIHFITKLGEK